MEPTILFLACLLGAVAIFLMLRPGKPSIRAVGGLLGLGVFGWFIIQGAAALAQAGGHDRPEAFFLIFSVIAVASAVKMIIHEKPVYSALYFVMVVLASAALFLLLEAEFMAFALVIVYAGAILITYMFVLMLAQQQPNADKPDEQAEYDRFPREPAQAAVVGFMMLALLSSMVFDGIDDMQPAVTAEQANAQSWGTLRIMPQALAEAVRAVDPNAVPKAGATVNVVQGVPLVEVIRQTEQGPVADVLRLPADAMPNNVQLVGLDLVHKFPVSLELAGVILLMAMFGAVVLARKQIELGEDEVREAAGMRRLDIHADDDPNSAANLMGGGAAQLPGGGRP